MKKQPLLFALLVLLFFTSCKTDLDNPTPSKKPEKGPSSSSSEEELNPTISTIASVSQDFIFNLDSVGFTTITIRRSEWNKMLSYYDYFYKNENNVIAESYEYEKDGKKWKLNTVGLRLRGNTSRFRPSGKDTPTDETGHTMPNASWSEDYYNNAATCSESDYRQSHFKVDFEPLSGDDRKMSECMKGVALKRSDSYFSKEIFCYHLFHQFGIWTAPRASQTKVYIKIIEDIDSNGNAKEDISKCKTTKIDYGVYEMFEEVNKQSLKGRMAKKGNNTAPTAWKNNNGDLWKCAGGDLTSSGEWNFGIEDIKINDTTLPKEEWLNQPEKNISFYNPTYDLKTNKSELSRATVYFQGFIDELSNLSNYNKDTDAGQNARKAFYEKWFDVDFFIKTYAVNILVGMDDDYWGNHNNYYLYFDNGSGGSGKCYFIPFDYDNTLGSSINRDKVYVNPLDWGWNEDSTTKILSKQDSPLLDRLLEVPEYLEKMKATLLEVSSQDPDSPWNKNNCFAFWNKIQSQVQPYVYSADLKAWPDISSLGIDDVGGWKEHKHYLTKDSENIYEQTTLNFRYWLTDGGLKLKFDLNGGTLNGETDVIEKDFDNTKANLDAQLDSIPQRAGYEFIGWTKTKDGSDFVTSYKGEDNFTVYAYWQDISSFEDRLSIFKIKDDSFNGLKIGIVNLPENHYRRTIKINGIEVGSDELKIDNNGTKVPNPKYGKTWSYPFVEPGKEYKITIEYTREDWGWLGSSNELTVTADSGVGEFKVKNTPEFYIQNNILKWKAAPIVQIGNGKTTRTNDNWDEYYLIEVQSTNQYLTWNWQGSSCNKNFNFKDNINHELENTNEETKKEAIRKVLDKEDKLQFKLKYIYNAEPYGNYCLVIYDFKDINPFYIE